MLEQSSSGSRATRADLQVRAASRIYDTTSRWATRVELACTAAERYDGGVKVTTKILANGGEASAVCRGTNRFTHPGCDLDAITAYLHLTRHPGREPHYPANYRCRCTSSPLLLPRRIVARRSFRRTARRRDTTLASARTTYFTSTFTKRMRKTGDRE